jgi:uracil-DNA glycosylase
VHTRSTRSIADGAVDPDPRAGLAAVERGAADWAAVARAARRCRACPLWRLGTQTVFGEGPLDARVVLVGEQPGDREDLAGRPFIGPAGQLLERALAEAGLPREGVYLTNAVKHFKWRRSGKRRLHERPSIDEARACRPWLLAELQLLEPDAIVCLGATAARSLLGPRLKVTQVRGRPVPSTLAPLVFATVHPSALLRVADEAERRTSFARFVADLRGVERALASRRRVAAHETIAPARGAGSVEDGEAMADGTRKKKDGQDPGKKRRRMRADVARRKARGRATDRSGNQPDIVKYKPGSASDRNRTGAI